MNDAANYKKVNRNARRETREVLEEYVDKMCWSPGDLVLDIGSGAGDTTAEILLPALPGDIGKIVGIDLSHAMVEHAAASQRHHKLCFTQMDIASKQLDKVKLAEMTRAKQLDKPHVEGVFNKVFSFFCLNWVQDQKRAFKNVYELMKPGGEGLVIFLSNCAIFDMYEVLAESPKWSPFMKDASSHISPYHKSSDPVAEFTAVLSEAGFEITTCINEPRRFSYESMSHLKGILETINPFIQRIPEHLRDAYMGDCISEITSMKSIEFSDRNNLNEDGHVVTRYYGCIVAHFSKKHLVAPSTKLA